MERSHAAHGQDLVEEMRTAVRLAMPAFKLDEIEQLDDRWPGWGVIPDEPCKVPYIDTFTPAALLTQMAAALIEDHPDAFQGIAEQTWEYGWFPKQGEDRCWLLNVPERRIALNSTAVAAARLTNRQVRVQLHEGMIQAEHRLTRILDRIAQPRRPKGASNQQLRLIGE